MSLHAISCVAYDVKAFEEEAFCKAVPLGPEEGGQGVERPHPPR